MPENVNYEVFLKEPRLSEVLIGNGVFKTVEQASMVLFWILQNAKEKLIGLQQLSNGRPVIPSFYRMGHKGYCDLQFIESASGGFYYPEHLPIMGKNEEEMEWDAILDTIDAQQIKQLEESEVRLINRAEIDPKMAYSSIIIDYNKIINASEVNMYKKVVSTRSPRTGIYLKNFPLCQLTKILLISGKL
ncbi:hypothetical protein NQ317_012069 [Molorchus minor]|uniref:Uncharacterized protein n=1 Tax=Molorchus minor TaxID=1323400 RepID=A0ABQ9K5U8_9CUCU|nr:hypothetical protein NQ317_012069 [Molorchus minor]